jgi:hypothetical protein
MPHRLARSLLPALLACGILAVPSVSNAAEPGVSPSTVETTLAPGASTIVEKTVQTATVASSPDILFLADTTGSMGDQIANVQASISDIISTIRDVQPDARFGAAQYKDEGDAFVYQLDAAITADDPTVTDAVDSWFPDGGGDTPEGQVSALYHLGTDSNIGWRDGSSHIIVQFGDAPGHDPSEGHTLDDAIAALQGLDVRYIGIDVLALDQVPNESSSDTGQATLLANATGGLVLPEDGDVSNAILEGLQSLDATVEPVVGTCDEGLDISWDQDSQTVDPGTAATFQETIAVAGTATPGSTLTCEVMFTVNGGVDPAFLETSTVHVEGEGTSRDHATEFCESGCTVTTDPGTGATADDPVVTTLIVPSSADPQTVTIDETDASTQPKFCGGKPCDGQLVEFSEISGVGDIRDPIVAKITFDQTVHEGSKIYILKDGQKKAKKVKSCKKPGIAKPHPCVSSIQNLSNGDRVFTILLLSQDPITGKR